MVEFTNGLTEEDVECRKFGRKTLYQSSTVEELAKECRKPDWGVEKRFI